MNEGCHGRHERSLRSAGMSDRSREVTVRVVRVFTRDGGGGNPLGIHDGVLDDPAMQSIATTLGYSETIFIDAAADDGVADVRIFTPASELPFAGHPLVGATWYVATPQATVALRCGIGVVAGHRPTEDSASIEVAYLPTVERTTAPDTTAAWIAAMPLPYEVHQLAGPDDVAAYELEDRPAHRLIWARADGGDEPSVRARFFAPVMGVDEDPATGSAAVALAAVLRHEGQSSGALTINQGAEIGCPSRIDLSWTARDTVIGGTIADDGLRTISVRSGS